MSIILNQGLSTEYIFPERRFSLDQLPWMKRFAESERAYQHGSVVTSDEKIKSRPGRIWGTLSYSTRAAFRSALEELRSACSVDDPTLHASDYWPNRYVSVKIISVDGRYYPALLAGEIEVLFRVTDPFWYSDSLSTHNRTILSSLHTFTLSFDGLIEVPPVITYIAGGEQMRVRILNEGDGDREWIYTGSLSLNDELEVDTEEATVEVNGTSRIHNFRGAWWNLQPGSNEIQVRITGTVGSSALQMAYRKRWL